VPFGVHALNVGLIILTLRTITGTPVSLCTDNAAEQQSNARTDPGALVPADGRSGYGANGRPDDRAAHTWIVNQATYLLRGILAALQLIPAEIAVILPGSRQSHQARTGRHAGASAKQHQHGRNNHCGKDFHVVTQLLINEEGVAATLVANRSGILLHTDNSHSMHCRNTSNWVQALVAAPTVQYRPVAVPARSRLEDSNTAQGNTRVPRRGQ